jgi:hypothetical protein
VGHVAYAGEVRNECTILAGKLQAKKKHHVHDLGTDYKITLRRILKNIV